MPKRASGLRNLLKRVLAGFGGILGDLGVKNDIKMIHYWDLERTLRSRLYIKTNDGGAQQNSTINR